MHILTRRHVKNLNTGKGPSIYYVIRKLAQTPPPLPLVIKRNHFQTPLYPFFSFIFPLFFNSKMSKFLPGFARISPKCALCLAVRTKALRGQAHRHPERYVMPVDDPEAQGLHMPFLQDAVPLESPEEPTPTSPAQEPESRRNRA